MMVGFRRIQVVLFLMMKLQFTVTVTGQNVSITVRRGDDVTLPCGNGTENPKDIDRVDWSFRASGTITTNKLFRNRSITTEFQFKSDRLSVTSWSLLIKKVTDEDVGHYTCEKFNKGQRQGSDWVDLSLTGLPPSSIIIIILAVTLTFLLVIVAVIYARKKLEDKKIQVDENVTDPEDVVSYASIIFTKKNQHKVQDRTNDDEGDSVTYSSVKPSSSAAAGAAASTDPEILYAAVK